MFFLPERKPVSSWHCILYFQSSVWWLHFTVHILHSIAITLHWGICAKNSPAVSAKSCQLCPTLCNTIDRSPPGSRPWDSPGKKTGVGCHFLLQFMKVKSESEITQSSLTLHHPMDCSHHAPPSMGFSRQEYWSGLPLPSNNDSF